LRRWRLRFLALSNAPRKSKRFVDSLWKCLPLQLPKNANFQKHLYSAFSDFSKFLYMKAQKPLFKKRLTSALLQKTSEKALQVYGIRWNLHGTYTVLHWEGVCYLGLKYKIAKS